jgi:multidrug transporter EmrE-like cation transporter
MLNTISQIFIKKGMNAIGYFEFSLQNLWTIGLKVATSLYIFTGLTCYVFSFIFWLLTLSRMDVSLAYPLSSIGYIMTALASYFILQEKLPLIKIVGIFIIMIGVYVVSRS